MLNQKKANTLSFEIGPYQSTFILLSSDITKKHKGIRFSLGQGGPTHGSLCVCWKLQLPAGVVLQPRDLVRSPPGPQVTEHWPHADHGVNVLPASKCILIAVIFYQWYGIRMLLAQDI